MRIEELDMTLRTWSGCKRVGHARTADGRSITVGVITSTDEHDDPRAYEVTLMQGPVSVAGGWHPTMMESYEQAVLEALEGAPKLAATVSDIAWQVRVKRNAKRAAAAAADQAERDEGITPIADMHPIDEGSHW